MGTASKPLIPMWELHSKREKLACLTDFARWKLGLLNKYLNIDYSRVDRVIFVCKGNICRSAYAEAKFNMLASGAISAGTEAKDGGPANPDAIRFAAERGVDLKAHRTQNIRNLKSKMGDLFVCMEKMHAEVVATNFDADKGQILLVGGLTGIPRISDPYGKEGVYFGRVFSEIDEALKVLWGKVSTKNGIGKNNEHTLQADSQQTS